MQVNRYFLALLSAFLLWLGWCPMPYTAPLLLVAFVPLLVGIEHLITAQIAHKGRKIFGLSFLCCLLWNVSCIYWVYHSIAAYNDAAIAFGIALIPFTLAPLLMAFCFWMYYQSRKRTNLVISFLLLISSWLSVEYLQQTWDLAFPWMNLGNGFAQFHQLIQWYSYTGIYGGSLWILLCNVLFFAAWLSKDKLRKIINSSGIALVIGPMAISLGLYFNYSERSNPCNVVVVQPNIDPYAKTTGEISPAQQINTLIRLSDSAAKVNTEYIIWPETAISGFVNEDNILSTPLFGSIQTFLYKYKNATLLSGMEGYKTYNNAASNSAQYNPSDRLYYDSFNTAIQLDNNPNIQLYHKSKLVPGVERMPFAHALAFLKPVFSHFGGSVGGYGSQENPGVFYAQSGIALSPVICYESIWGNWVAQSVENGAQFIAIITNDAWWGNTSGKDQHAAYAKLRAIENRRWVARAANTGISCIINARGDIISRSQWWTQTALNADINLNTEITFYTQHGDYLVGLCLAIFGILSIYLLGKGVVIKRFRD